MPDIGTILMLLTSGAATVAAGQAKGAVDQAIQDTYQKLKELLKKRFEETQDDKKAAIANVVLEKYEEDPAVWKAPLAQELIRADVDHDEQIVETVQKLASLVTPKDAAYDRIATAANATRQQLERIYEQGREQAKQWSLFSLVAAIAGFLVRACAERRRLGIMASQSGDHKLAHCQINERLATGMGPLEIA